MVDAGTRTQVVAPKVGQAKAGAADVAREQGVRDKACFLTISIQKGLWCFGTPVMYIWKGGHSIYPVLSYI